MSWSVTLAGETFTDANVAGTAYADEATGFPAILAAFAREAAFLKGLAATSATPLTPSTGAVAFTTHQDATTVGLSPGMLVRVVSASDPTRLMIGTVTAFTGTALELDVTFANGTTAADWVITRPTGGSSLALDPAPALAADLNAAGYSLDGVLNLIVSALASLTNLRVSGGDEWRELDLGTVTAAVSGSPANTSLQRLTLGADIDVEHAPPTSGYVYWKQWTVLQDATGGRTPTFRLLGGAAGLWPNDDEPEWTDQDPEVETTVVAKVGPGAVLKLYVGG
ncbi:hypothetical protein BAL199_17283 [alpha proteobacterium BAL199]|jgi:hypothetical protein|nr:hypothetical protein BAL199_17283 [alpha proteobacterium BAL199]